MNTRIRTFTLACTLAVTLTACDSLLEPETGTSPDFAVGAAGRPGGGVIVNPTDDQRIVYVSFTTSYPEGGFDLYAMNPDGSDVERLTSTLDQDFSPDVSPDGSQIAFERTSNIVTGEQHIYVKDMDPFFLDGSDVVQLTFEGQDNQGPTWSSDGSSIAFSSNRDGHFDLYMMASDGSGVERLTTNPGSFDGHAAWSPDGNAIAFTSYRDSNLEIYVLSKVGNGKKLKFNHLTRLTNHGASDSHPTWSADGSKIAFVSDRDGNSEIYSMNADGTGVVRLTNDPAHDRTPAWSLGGSRIAFESDRDGNFELYAMNVDGSNVTRLTDNPHMDISATWAN